MIKIATDPNGFIDEYLQKELKLGLYKAQQTCKSRHQSTF
jgi:hypothetical protein